MLVTASLERTAAMDAMACDCRDGFNKCTKDWIRWRPITASMEYTAALDHIACDCRDDFPQVWQVLDQMGDQ